MSSFTDYEKHHLHNYVYKKETLYAKQEVDIKMTALKSEIRLQLSETLFWESYQLADCLYKIDRGIPSEVTFDNSTRVVSDLFDQSLKENHSNQTTQANRPILCTKAEKINYRYYLKFDGNKRMLSNINLNPGSGQADIVNVFIVYRLNSYTGSYAVRNGLFGHDNGGYDKFVAFSPTGELLISGTTNQHIVIGSSSFNSKNATAPYQSKANAGELINGYVYQFTGMYLVVTTLLKHGVTAKN